jgi:hypothetical protein
MTLREAAEDLRDGAAKLAAAVIAGRLDDAAYTFNALILDSVKDVERELQARQISRKDAK